ncbi:MAG: hypothetical protein MI725_12505, partial [Pirellulales bacterium]|nr:hypothetical protein [Pirellulales bacterium]
DIKEAPKTKSPKAGNSRGLRRRANEPATPTAYVPSDAPSFSSARKSRDPVKIFPFGVARNRLSNAAKRLGVPINAVKEAGEADVLVTLRSYYRKRQRTIVDAEQRGVPVYVLRANTVSQMERFLSGLFDLPTSSESNSNVEQQLQNTQRAIQAVLNGERWVEMPPTSSYVRRMQHQMAQESNLVSHSYGKEPNRRVRIFRE